MTRNSGAGNHLSKYRKERDAEMTPTPTTNADAVELLRRLGATGVEHPGGTLLAHLGRVADLLEEWAARPALCLAGLCHAVYGTDGFATALLPVERRAELASVIGSEAEELVYGYGSCDRKASYPGLADGGVFVDRFTGAEVTLSTGQRRDFAELTAANELDVVRHSVEPRRNWADALLGLFTRIRPLLSAAAWETCRAELAG